MTYAATTKVPVGRTKTEIERTLTRYGADRFAYFTESGKAIIVFEAPSASSTSTSSSRGVSGMSPSTPGAATVGSTTAAATGRPDALPNPARS